MDERCVRIKFSPDNHIKISEIEIDLDDEEVQMHFLDGNSFPMRLIEFADELEKKTLLKILEEKAAYWNSNQYFIRTMEFEYLYSHLEKYHGAVQYRLVRGVIVIDIDNIKTSSLRNGITIHEDKTVDVISLVWDGGFITDEIKQESLPFQEF